MRNRNEKYNNGARQSGVVLFISMILLLILSMIGVTVARMQTVEERMARNEDNRQLAAQAAEAALRSVEAGLQTGIYNNFAANTNGLYSLSPTTGSNVPGLNWSNPAQVLTYAGPALANVPISAAQQPKFVIEQIQAVALPGEDIASPPPAFQITVQASGADGNPSTMLQSIFRYR